VPGDRAPARRSVARARMCAVLHSSTVRLSCRWRQRGVVVKDAGSVRSDGQGSSETSARALGAETVRGDDVRRVCACRGGRRVDGVDGARRACLGRAAPAERTEPAHRSATRDGPVASESASSPPSTIGSEAATAASSRDGTASAAGSGAGCARAHGVDESGAVDASCETPSRVVSGTATKAAHR
jgi:hypothetical protein